ncbi:hypothetical protein ACU19_00885 [Actinobaculum suis]|nr:hypothetical protein ACU19_00885 [Actinobaculum suis]
MVSIPPGCGKTVWLAGQACGPVDTSVANQAVETSLRFHVLAPIPRKLLGQTSATNSAIVALSYQLPPNQTEVGVGWLVGRCG